MPADGERARVAPLSRPVPVDAGRLPPFFGLGLRLEKRWTMGDAGHVALVFEMLNATLARDYVAPGRRTGPITIPSVALEAAN